jgi:hypothetical protein
MRDRGRLVYPVETACALQSRRRPRSRIGRGMNGEPAGPSRQVDSKRVIALFQDLLDASKMQVPVWHLELWGINNQCWFVEVLQRETDRKRHERYSSLQHHVYTARKSDSACQGTLRFGLLLVVTAHSASTPAL